MVRARFSAGRDFLAAYWGYLANGGLVLDGSDAPPEGTALWLDVEIESVGVEARLRGNVVRAEPAVNRIVVAFTPDSEQDRLLSAALAECDQAMSRRDCRYIVSCDAAIEGEAARVVNVSRTGLCIATPGWPRHAVGASLQVAVADQTFHGQVRWTDFREMGVELDGDQDASALARLPLEP